MTVNRTTLLDLPLPVTGTESGTWGDTTNNGLTQYVDIAIAGMSNLTSANFTAGALTIETTEGDSSATNISATSAQYAGFRVTSLAANSTITVGNTGTSPARSYRLINADATYNLTFKATGQTGVTLLPGQSALVAFNGTDYVIVGTVGAGSTTDNTVPRFDGTTGKILQSSGITIDDSNNVSGVAQLNITTLDATNIEVTNIKAKDGTAAASIADSTGVISVTANPVLSGGTANGVLYLNGSKVATSGSALTFDGTNLGIGTSSPTNALTVGTTSAGKNIAIYSSSNGNNGLFRMYDLGGTERLQLGVNSTGEAVYYAPTGSVHAWYVNTERMRLDSSGNLGIGTSSPASRLDVYSTGNTTLTLSGSSGGGGDVSQIDFLRIGSNVTSSIKAIRDGGNTSGALTFYTAVSGSNTERMRLDSSGNLGLGVTPSAKLDVANASGRAARVGGFQFSGTTSSADGGNNLLGSGIYWNGSNLTATQTTGAVLQLGNGVIQFQTLSGLTAGNTYSFAPQLSLDSSGNLGLGVTPSAWGTAKAFQIGGSGFALSSNGAGSGDGSLIWNGYYNGTNWIYSYTGGVATRYRQNESGHAWFTAASGTAGNAIPFTQAMTLDAGGNLLVGGTSSLYGVGGRGDVEINGSSTSILALTIAGSATNASYLYNTSTELEIAATGSRFMRFTTNGSERARITSGGDLLVGTTSNSNTSRCFIENAGSNVLTVSNSAAGGYNFITRAQSNGGTYYHASFEESTTQRGSITSNGSATAYNTSSDYRLKNIDGPLTGSGEFIDALKPKVGTWKTNGSKFVGFLAHEVQEVSPGSVVGTKDAVDEEGKPIMQAMEYGSAEFIANIIAEIQSLRQRVALLEGN